MFSHHSSTFSLFLPEVLHIHFLYSFQRFYFIHFFLVSRLATHIIRWKRHLLHLTCATKIWHKPLHLPVLISSIRIQSCFDFLTYYGTGYYFDFINSLYNDRDSTYLSIFTLIGKVIHHDSISIPFFIVLKKGDLTFFHSYFPFCFVFKTFFCYSLVEV